jgi:3-oxoacyl-[acyl-carrier protein] reductase
VARTAGQVEAVAAEIAAAGGTALALPGDVADAESVAAFCAAAREKFGRIDILVNNAGVFKVASVAETTLEDWDTILGVNARGPFLCIQQVLPEMMARRSGVIINIASQAGLKHYPRQGAYCASKHALVGLTRVLADEMREYNVRVAAICPGGVATELVFRERPDWGPDQLMSPDDIAECVAWIAQLPLRMAVDILPVRRWLTVP